MQCPKCDSPLEQARYESITIDRCTGCHGIWFHPDSLAELKDMWRAEFLDNPRNDLQGGFDLAPLGQARQREAHGSGRLLFPESHR